MKYEVIVAKETTEAACTVLWLEKFTSTYTSFQNLIVPALQQLWLQGSFKPSYESLEASFLLYFKFLQWENLCLSTDFISINLGFSLVFCVCAFGRGHVETVRFPQNILSKWEVSLQLTWLCRVWVWSTLTCTVLWQMFFMILPFIMLWQKS